MPRLRVTLALSILVLLLSVGATALLSSVQRLGDGTTLDAGPHRAVRVPLPRRAMHPPQRATSPPASDNGATGSARAAEPRPLHAPAPHYPIEALRAHRQGLVRLRVQLDAQGRVSGTAVQQSSGDPQLDRAAQAAVRDWKFTMPPGARRQTTVPIRFHIDAPGG
jgi:periplasmic protein TonB